MCGSFKCIKMHFSCIKLAFDTTHRMLIECLNTKTNPQFLGLGASPNVQVFRFFFLFFHLCHKCEKRKGSLKKGLEQSGLCHERWIRREMEGDECGACCWMMRCVMEPNLLSAERGAPSVLWMWTEKGGEWPAGRRGGRRRRKKT